jgi:hypothetical protein
MDETIAQPEASEDDILIVEWPDAAIEAAAGPVGAIPTASIDIIPPNCC